VETPSPSEVAKQEHDDLGVVRLVFPFSQEPILQKIRKPATVQSLLHAEQAMGHIGSKAIATNNMGHQLNLQAQIEPFQQIHFHETTPVTPCPIATQAGRHPNLHGQNLQSRFELLIHQQSWVAVDEMNFYLSQFQHIAKCTLVPALQLPADHGYNQALTGVGKWIEQLRAHISDGSEPAASACLIGHHWIPFLVRQHEGQFIIQSSMDGGEILADILHLYSDDVHYHDHAPAWTALDPKIQIREVPYEFQGDCGFQTAIWISNHDCTTSECQAITASQASIWRDHFQHHLLVTGQAYATIQKAQFALGGAKAGETLEHSLADLLRSHGVPHDAAVDRAQEIFLKLGRQAISQVMRAPQPWRELKAKANSQHPKVQLVHPSELQDAIRARAETGKPVGQGRKKKPAPKPQVRLQPDDVSIPDGIFRQEPNIPLQQLTLHQIGPDAQGVVVTDSVTAAPFLKMKQPVSKHGLALLILDHAAPSIQHM
jgi:hypothetical protein